MGLVSAEEDLHTSCDPDCELHNGILVPRTGGAAEHSRLHGALSAYLHVVPGAQPGEQIFQTSPRPVIEMLIRLLDEER